MIYAVRHGETEWNASNKILGRTDIPLNDKGMDQARTAACSLRGLKADVFLCSPLARARQTADFIAKEIGMDYTIDNRLIEQDFGIFEGRARDDKEYQSVKREYFVRYPGGESYFDMASRVYPLIRELKGKDVILVTHGEICRIIRSYFEDMWNGEFMSFTQGNCEVKIYGE